MQEVWISTRRQGGIYSLFGDIAFMLVYKSEAESQLHKVNTFILNK